MKDHSHYEELTALAAGGFLSDSELTELSEHAVGCSDCRKDESEFANLAHFQLPLTVSPMREFLDTVRTRPNPELRERFLKRARLEGIGFSPALAPATVKPSKPRIFWPAAATALATLLITIAILKTRTDRPVIAQQPANSQPLIDQLKTENSALAESVAQLNQLNGAQQREVESLRKQVKSASETAETSRREGEQARADAQQAAQQNADLLSQIQDRDKLLANAQSELARIKDEHSSDQASLVAQQTQINDLSDQLRIANADLDLERQLASAGKDVRELMGARQLHVVDVRDTDPSGNSSKPFGRVFLTEGKSLIFYAFDLNENKVASAKHSFEVWGEQQGKKGSVRSLGFLFVDDKSQKRWALKVDNPNLISEIDSVFVTVESPEHKKEPSGQRMLYAYLGDANHP
jgi:hypothetical protein